MNAPCFRDVVHADIHVVFGSKSHPLHRLYGELEHIFFARAESRSFGHGLPVLDPAFRHGLPQPGHAGHFHPVDLDQGGGLLARGRRKIVDVEIGYRVFRFQSDVLPQRLDGRVFADQDLCAGLAQIPLVELLVFRRRERALRQRKLRLGPHIDRRHQAAAAVCIKLDQVSQLCILELQGLIE